METIMRILLMTIFLLAVSASVALGCSPVQVQGRVWRQEAPDVYRAVYGASVSSGFTAVRTNGSGYYNLSVPNCGAVTLSAKAKTLSFDSVTLYLPLESDSYLWSGTDDVIHLDFYALPDA